MSFLSWIESLFTSPTTFAQVIAKVEVGAQMAVAAAQMAEATGVLPADVTAKVNTALPKVQQVLATLPNLKAPADVSSALNDVAEIAQLFDAKTAAGINAAVSMARAMLAQFVSQQPAAPTAAPA